LTGDRRFTCISPLFPVASSYVPSDVSFSQNVCPPYSLRAVMRSESGPISSIEGGVFECIRTRCFTHILLLRVVQRYRDVVYPELALTGHASFDSGYSARLSRSLTVRRLMDLAATTFELQISIPLMGFGFRE